MGAVLPEILDRIEAANPKHAHKLRAQVGAMDGVFHARAEEFFRRYERFIASQGKTLDFGVGCYLKLCASMMKERILFLRAGRYSSSSFDEVSRRVYSHPETMQHHMHGLVFAQFFWPEQYRRFSFFCENLPRYGESVRRYLEVGGGHALYITEACRLLGGETEFDLVDISPHSMALARGIAREPRIRCHLMNIFDFLPGAQYDWITMGEVIEHVEQPLELLRKARSLLAPSGRAYITAPANAPTLDHIYLFREEEEIRGMLRDAGFAVEREVLMYSEDLPVEQARARKVALMYGAVVKNAEPPARA